jgi:O-antigen/teichoic acid export membrane protein
MICLRFRHGGQVRVVLERPRPAAPQAAAPPLRRNVAWILGGYAAAMSCQWGMLAVLARWGSAEDVGRFGVALAVAGPAALLSQLGLRKLLATDADLSAEALPARRSLGEGGAKAEGTFAFGHYLGLRLAASAILGVALAALAVAGPYPDRTAGAILAMGAAKAIEGVSDILYGLFQREERMDLLGRSLAARGVAGGAGLAAAFAATGSVAWGVAGLAAGGAAVLALHDLPASRRLLGAPVRPAWAPWALAGTALPLGIVTFLGAALAALPVFLLERFTGEAAAGIFTALAYLPAGANRVVSALGEATAPRLARRHAAGAGGLLPKIRATRNLRVKILRPAKEDR